MDASMRVLQLCTHLMLSGASPNWGTNEQHVDEWAHQSWRVCSLVPRPHGNEASEYDDITTHYSSLSHCSSFHGAKDFDSTSSSNIFTRALSLALSPMIMWMSSSGEVGRGKEGSCRPSRSMDRLSAYGPVGINIKQRVKLTFLHFFHLCPDCLIHNNPSLTLTHIHITVTLQSRSAV